MPTPMMKASKQRTGKGQSSSGKLPTGLPSNTTQPTPSILNYRCLINPYTIDSSSLRVYAGSVGIDKGFIVPDFGWGKDTTDTATSGT